MTNFLQYIAEMLSDKYKSDLSNCCIIFPNRRAGLFFKKHLASLNKTPVWVPKIITINELMQDLSGLQLADNLTLVFELYKIYITHKKSTESFDEFYFWGEMILNDFDDVDKYLINAEDLFSNLSSLKSIKEQFNYLTPEQLEAIQHFWKSFGSGKYTKHQSDFIQVWDILYNIYIDFNKLLDSQKLAYEGRIYRNVAEKTSKKEGLHFHYSRYFFIGLNALNPCEEKLADTLFNLRLAEFYWDYDQYYINNKFHEAGHFLRKNLKKYPPADSSFSFDQLKQKKKAIEIVACPSNISQTKVLGQILSEKITRGTESAENIAVVLADEHLLVPALYSIPSGISEINVTMGYPLKNAPVVSLLEHIAALQKNAKTGSNEEIKFYHKNVTAILKHQYINSFTQGNDLINQIIKNNKIYIPQEELQTEGLPKQIFTPIKNVTGLTRYLLQVLYTISGMLKNQKSEGENNTLPEQEFIYHVFTDVKRMGDIIEREEINLSVEIYWRLLARRMQNARIPFSGEPLAGLQVMGLLETRTLDFETVIILSVNEGILPRTDTGPSFIPYNLRQGFGLPTFEHQDAISAYYFYRLIQRAKNISILYNASAEGLSSGEKSRYIYQLHYGSIIKIEEKSLTYDINNTQPQPILVKKTPAVLKILDTYTGETDGAKYLSPSALNTYLTCSLRFYFKYIAHMAEPDELDEEVDPALFGNLLHHAMYLLYLPYKGKEITAGDAGNIQKNKEAIGAAINNSFSKEYFNSSNQADITGRNIIIKEVLKKYIYQILETDKQYAPFTILGLENFFETGFTFLLDGKQKTVRIGGKIDRVDKINEITRIIDYKTGDVKFSFDSIPGLFAKDHKTRNNAVFQTLLYALLYAESEGNKGTLAPGLYATKEMHGNAFDYKLKIKNSNTPLYNYHEVAEEFKEQLALLLQEIHNPENDFTQTEDKETCKNCPYIAICKKGIAVNLENVKW